MTVKRLFLLHLVLLPVFLAASCSKESQNNELIVHGLPTEMILDVKFPGDVKASKVAIDNERRKVVLDFKAGAKLEHVDMCFVLEDGVSLTIPTDNPSSYDLTKTCSIVLTYSEEDYRYLVISNIDGEDSNDDIMQDGPLSDIALMYYGGTHRIGKSDWTSEQLRSNVSYKDRKGNEHWLFDSFLFLETSDGGGHYFESGFDDPRKPDPNSKGANKEDWLKILDRYFAEDGPIARLDKEIGYAVQRISPPKYIRRLVVFIPAAFYNQKNWGTISGAKMDFSINEHRIIASKWYVDQVILRFNSLHLRYLALDGIYYVSEQLTNNRSYIPDVADYVKSKNLKFYWIPYWGADGMGDWKKMRFDTAFLQPNYAFPPQKPDYDSYFKSIMNYAFDNNMDLEMELDERALYNSHDYRADRVRDYLKAFKAYGVTGNKKIAYYQSDCMVHSLKTSEYEQDNDLYHDLCSMIIERQNRRGEK